MKGLDAINILLICKHSQERERIEQFLKENQHFQLTEELNGNCPQIYLIVASDGFQEDCGKMIKQLRKKCPLAKLVIVSSASINSLLEAMRCGADGYLPNILDKQLWQQYLQELVCGEQRFSAKVGEQMLEMFENVQRYLVAKTLTTREREIIQWVAEGSTNKEIAERLMISEYTVKNHLKNIFHKLQISNRVQLVRYALIFEDRQKRK